MTLHFNYALWSGDSSAPRIGGKVGPLLLLEGDVEAITNNFNEVMTEVATDILGFSRPKTQPWATDRDYSRI